MPTQLQYTPIDEIPEVRNADARTDESSPSSATLLY